MGRDNTSESPEIDQKRSRPARGPRCVVIRGSAIRIDRAGGARRLLKQAPPRRGREFPRAKISGIRILCPAPHPCRSEAAGAGRGGSAARAGHLAAAGRHRARDVAPRRADGRGARCRSGAGTGGGGGGIQPEEREKIAGGRVANRRRRSGREGAGRREKRRGGEGPFVSIFIIFSFCFFRSTRIYDLIPWLWD